MDNLGFGSSEEDEILNTYHTSINIFKEYGFGLQQFASNSNKFNSMIVQDSGDVAVKSLFGINWELESDSYTTKSIILNINSKTKREVLSSLNSIYDPLGMLIPILNRAKLFMHTLQCDKVGWDKDLNEERIREWKNIVKQYNSSHSLKIPRYLGDYTSKYRLLAFCDASKDFYACVLYLQDINTNQCKFLLCKNRVVNTTMKTKSIPVLELYAMSFAVKIAVDTFSELSNAFCPVNICSLHVYSDSMIVLSWLLSKVHTFNKIERKGPVVNNQLDSIVKCCKVHPISFYHIGGLDNPADKCSRCVSARVLSGTNFLSGPAFTPDLLTNEFVSVPAMGQDRRYVCNTVGIDASFPPIIPFDRFSVFRKLYNVTHYVFKYLDRLKRTVNERIPTMFPDMGDHSYHDAGRYLIRCAQSQIFTDEFNYLKYPGKVSNAPTLVHQLNLFIDDEGILRVRGKMQKYSAPFEEKFPILLCKTSKLAHLLISDMHWHRKHIGIYKLLTLIRKEFYITSAYSTVKKLINKCVLCKKFYGRTVNINQNSYKSHRVNPSQVPFREIALDHLGPFNIKNNGSKQKIYILIITCYYTRAVNLLICKSLDSESFIMAFQEHIFSYGLPSRIVSDNGSSIVSSVKLIKSFLEDEEVKNFLTERNIKSLSFEPYPAHASFLGGIVESLVKQVKNMVYSSMGRNVLALEQFSLLIRECNMLINKRPISCNPLLTNPFIDRSALVITPELLIRGYDVPSVAVVPHLSAEDSPVGDAPWCLDRAAAEEHLLNTFSKLGKVRHRLKLYYYDHFIQKLQQESVERPGRYKPKSHLLLEVGDLVAIKCKFTKPYSYPSGIVQSVEINDIDEVVSVEVRKGNGECVRRHVTDIILLEKAACVPNDVAESSTDNNSNGPPRRSLRLQNKVRA
jgi:hypothetical protein